MRGGARPYGRADDERHRPRAPGSGCLAAPDRDRAGRARQRAPPGPAALRPDRGAPAHPSDGRRGHVPALRTEAPTTLWWLSTPPAPAMTSWRAWMPGSIPISSSRSPSPSSRPAWRRCYGVMALSRWVSGGPRTGWDRRYPPRREAAGLARPTARRRVRPVAWLAGALAVALIGSSAVGGYMVQAAQRPVRDLHTATTTAAASRGQHNRVWRVCRGRQRGDGARLRRGQPLRRLHRERRRRLRLRRDLRHQRRHRHQRPRRRGRADACASRSRRGKTYTARLVGTDTADDLAVIHINATGLPAAHFAGAGTLQVAQTVLAIGNPLGLQQSVTSGLISALNRTVQESNGAYLPNAIQTSAPINPGNSGGALVDAGRHRGRHPHAGGHRSAEQQRRRGAGHRLRRAQHARDLRGAADHRHRARGAHRPRLPGRRRGRCRSSASSSRRGFGTAALATAGGQPTASDGALVQQVATRQPGRPGRGAAGRRDHGGQRPAVTGESDLLDALAPSKPGATMTLTLNRNGSTDERRASTLGELPANPS